MHIQHLWRRNWICWTYIEHRTCWTYVQHFICAIGKAWQLSCKWRKHLCTYVNNVYYAMYIFQLSCKWRKHLCVYVKMYTILCIYLSCPANDVNIYVYMSTMYTMLCIYFSCPANDVNIYVQGGSKNMSYQTKCNFSVTNKDFATKIAELRGEGYSNIPWKLNLEIPTIAKVMNIFYKTWKS